VQQTKTQRLIMDYKKYSLENLQNWVHDAMNSDASPHEIYSAIREAVREEYYYHKDCLSRATGLLELLSGHRPVADTLVEKAEQEYLESMYPDVPDDEPLVIGDTIQDKKYEVQYSNEIEKIRQDGGYEWTPEVKKDKVVKWQLSVESDDISGEYFVSLPDDLLEAANLKEGDFVGWMNQGDGSYLLQKHIERYRF
jgi:hypothetical protein